ncbi:thioredoxin domain-containing protein [Chitinophagaceae bacterium 26-R-25]|nr:thioredoxin domain-containing protein [Chitinophagaceae bacterium 26-R-25]
MSKPNHLATETSPYLLQHAYNPVEWFPWSDEALQKAKEENKPILVSIGYSACHWCHVMEKESFENEETAAIMNEYFVNIKIDREERPDIDQVYMDAVQAMTGSGGWPLNVFLTPDGKPFYGGTYYPPQQHYNRPSWTDVLHGVANAWHNKRQEVLQQAENLTGYIEQSNTFGHDQAEQNFTHERAATIFTNIMKQADTLEGGFGKAPKFPQTFSIQYLLKYYHFYKDEAALKQALLSLDKMIYGGIYDQLGGGFARYSTDAEWLAPHFEKMLYDNALLLITMAEAYQLTKNELYIETIDHTMAFITRELLSPENGFYAALDADSEGEEGKFYVWSKKEVEEVLGADADLFCKFYDITETGNWEHTNILRIKTSVDDFSQKHKIDLPVLKEKLKEGRAQLLNAREKRVRPGLDDKILLNWNALMNTACCKIYAATGKEEYKELALKNVNFLLQAFLQDENLFHTYKNGHAKIPAFLDDYAYLIQALINLQEITGDTSYLIKAKELTAHVLDNFSEAETGLFYFTGSQQKDIIVRKKEIYDAALPSGNAVMISNLYYLAVVFDVQLWHERCNKALGTLVKMCENYPTSFGVWCDLILEVIRGTREIVVTGEVVDEVRKEILATFIPYKVFQSASQENNLFPLLSGKSVTSQPLIFHCKNYSCSEPVNNVDLLLKQL